MFQMELLVFIYCLFYDETSFTDFLRGISYHLKL